MEPRLGSRGKTPLVNSRASPLSSLQWSRDLEVAESHHQGRKLNTTERLQWSRDLEVAERRSPKDGCRMLEELQWSRDLEVAERAERK